MKSRGGKMQTLKSESLWVDYEATKDKKVREQLIENYMPLVKHIVHRIHVSLPPYLDYEDLVSYGIFGLLQAIERYDASKNVKFETFAYARIKGSIIDELRKNDSIPQSIRAKAKSLQETYSYLEQTLGRTVTDEDLCQHLGISSAELQNIYEDISILNNIISLDDVILTETSEYALPEIQAEIEDVKRILSLAIEVLPPQEKLVVTLYYYEGLNFKEISQVMDLSQGRISQLHSKAILRLRGRLGRKKADL